MLPEKMMKAKNSMLLRFPFFGYLLISLKFVSDPECIYVMWTDSVMLGYNPAMVEELSRKQVVGLICHEVLHVALLHFSRRGNRTKDRWNKACDYAVNLIIDSIPDMELPSWVLLDHKYSDLSAEEIYEKLPGDTSGGDPGMGTAGDGTEENEGKGRIIGEIRDYVPNSSNKDYSNPSKLQKQKWRQAVSVAANIAKTQGSLPGSIERLIKDIIQPKLPWQELLASFVTSNVRADYNWEIPARNFIHLDIYLPSLDSPELTELFIIVDTSASIGQEEMDVFAAEIGSILHTYPNVVVTVIYVDAKVARVEEVSSREMELHPAGGGGTNFKPGFQYIEDNDCYPTCVIYLTDGYCNSFPDPSPDYNVLWVLTSSMKFDPPFGQVIIMDMHEEKY